MSNRQATRRDERTSAAASLNSGMHHLLRRYPFDLFIIFVFWVCVVVAYRARPDDSWLPTVGMYWAATLWAVFRPVISFRTVVRDESHLAGVAMTQISAAELIRSTLRLPILFAYLPVFGYLLYEVPPSLYDDDWAMRWEDYSWAAIDLTLPSAMCADLCARLALGKSHAKIGTRSAVWAALMMSTAYVHYWIAFLPWRWYTLPWYHFWVDLVDQLFLAINFLAIWYTYNRWRAAARELFNFR